MNMNVPNAERHPNRCRNFPIRPLQSAAIVAASSESSFLRALFTSRVQVGTQPTMPARTRARPKRRRAKRKRARRKQIAHLQQRMFQLKIPDEQVRIFLKNWSGHRPAFFICAAGALGAPAGINVEEIAAGLRLAGGSYAGRAVDLPG